MAFSTPTRIPLTRAWQSASTDTVVSVLAVLYMIEYHGRSGFFADPCGAYLRRHSVTLCIANLEGANLTTCIAIYF